MFEFVRVAHRVSSVQKKEVCSGLNGLVPDPCSCQVIFIWHCIGFLEWRCQLYSVGGIGRYDLYHEK